MDIMARQCKLKSEDKWKIFCQRSYQTDVKTLLLKKPYRSRNYFSTVWNWEWAKAWWSVTHAALCYVGVKYYLWKGKIGWVSGFWNVGLKKKWWQNECCRGSDQNQEKQLWRGSGNRMEHMTRRKGILTTLLERSVQRRKDEGRD